MRPYWATAIFLLAFPLDAEDLPDKAYTILKKECFACHGPGLKVSDLDLTTREAALAGGERGEAFVPHHPERSRIYQYAAHEQNPAMPPGKKLPDGDLDILRRWILAGAVYPGDAGRQEVQTDKAAALAALEERLITEEERNFWAFRKPVRRDPPRVRNASWARNAVDAFLLAAMEKKGLKPSPEADRRTLIRRAYLDLIGLPPSVEEVRAFLNDKRPDAWERLVDKLLASPHYGERWGRYWLDLVRYADSGGFEYDRDWPNAWRYRDYVVASFNSDKPYDQFIREQIAGDEIAPDSKEAHIATGFLRLGPENNIKTEMTRMDELDDLVSTTSLTFLGMTVGCARCHNHKFDPIPQKDYYRIQSVFFSTKAAEYPLVDESVVEAWKAEQKRIDELQKPLKDEKVALEKPYHDRLFEEKINKLPEYMQVAWRTPPEKRTAGQRLNARQIEKTLKIEEKEILAVMSEEDKAKHTALKEQIASLDKQRPARYESAMAISEHGREPLPSYFLIRGSPSSKGSLMKPGVLSVACDSEWEFPSPPETAKTSWRRRGFAEWVASPENPLTARVMVNRIWEHHFGRGIVATPSNFGNTGERPTHPELLDWLATEFIRQGWSVKAMHRLMMNSSAYRMASADIEANRAIDPENRLLWRMPRQRLEAEAIRDSIFAAAGTLDLTVGGPAVLPYIDPSLYQESSNRTWKGKPDEDRSTWRRSIYVFAKRSIRYPMFEAFDAPDMVSSCARRNVSTTAPQALLLMNNAAVRIQAEEFAKRLRREAGGDVEAQIKLGFEIALSRPPSASELERSITFVKASADGLMDFCHALFNLNEFVYRP
jgi:hypothetical protein